MILIFEEVVFGIIKEILICKDVICEICYGDGVKFGISKKICSYCNGVGYVVVE